MDDPIWISIELALAIHKRQLSEHGGLDGVRDVGLLQSALARPRQLFAYAEPPVELAQMAGVYAFGVARNHPFIDGNKRTAYVVCRTFLLLNGADITGDKVERYEKFLALADGSLSEIAFVDWLRGHVKAA